MYVHQVETRLPEVATGKVLQIFIETKSENQLHYEYIMISTIPRMIYVAQSLLRF